MTSRLFIAVFVYFVSGFLFAEEKAGFEVAMSHVSTKISSKRTFVCELLKDNKNKVLFAAEVGEKYKGDAKFTISTEFTPFSPSFVGILATADSERFDIFRYSFNLPELDGFEPKSVREWLHEGNAATLFLKDAGGKEASLKLYNLSKENFNVRYGQRKVTMVDVSEAQRNFEERLKNAKHEIYSTGEIASWTPEKRKAWHEKENRLWEERLKNKSTKLDKAFLDGLDEVNRIREKIDLKKEEDSKGNTVNEGVVETEVNDESVKNETDSRKVQTVGDEN